MAKYVIKYNPYQNTTVVEKNGGKLLDGDDICKGMNGIRLQSWFDETVSWPGIGKMLDDDNNGAVCEIEFCGREIDYIDLKNYFESIYKSSAGTEFKLSSTNLSSDEDMLSKLSDMIDDAKGKEFFSDDQIAELVDSIEHLKNEPFFISVLATMSSGKSTLLNALMHRELLPSGDLGTTANIVEIYDNDNESISYKTYDEDNNLVNEGYEANLDTFKSINEDNKVNTVKIYTDIPMVSAERMALVLRDTPGPNNADDYRHKRVTDKVIKDAKNMSTVLYIMNATQLKVVSDYELLRQISSEMRKGGKQANDRFLFVVNKVDEWIKKKEQTLQKLLDETTAYLKTFDINDPRIFLLTASLPNDIWRFRNGYTFDEFEIEDLDSAINKFNKINADRVRFDKYSSVSKCVERDLISDLENAIEKDDKYEVALILCGLRGLEYSIKEYMDKYAYPIKVNEALKKIKGTINEEKTLFDFNDAINSKDVEISKIQRQIDELIKDSEGRNQKKIQFEKEINNYVLSEEIKKNAKNMVKEEYAKILDEYRNDIKNQELLEQNDAKRIATELQGKIRVKEKELESFLREKFQEEVEVKGQAIREEYIQYLKEIKDSLRDRVSEFDFDNLDWNEFDFGFKDIDEVTDIVTKTESVYTEVKGTKKNPKYRKFLFLHWGGPEEIDYTQVIKTGEINYVDRNEFLDRMGDIQNIGRRNVEDLLKYEEQEIEKFKIFFSKEMEKFNQRIDEILNDLKAKTTQVDKEKYDRDKYKRQMMEFENYTDRIKSITDL